ncbi:S8 family peptidase [Aeromonas veronii]
MRKHFKISPESAKLPYKPINPVIPTKEYNIDRVKHYHSIYSSFNSAIKDLEEKKNSIRKTLGSAFKGGGQLVFAIESNTENPNRLNIKSLDNQSIKLLSVKQNNEKTIANVSIANDKLHIFSKKIKEYGNEKTKKGEPKNKSLIETIGLIRKSNIEDFWIGPIDIKAYSNKNSKFEVWFATEYQSVADIESGLHIVASKSGVILNNQHILFKDRLVKIVSANMSSLIKFVELLDCVVEIRPATTICDDYLHLNYTEQASWIGNISFIAEESPIRTCILDGGVNISHQLLYPHSDKNVQVTYDPNWGVDDRKGHGTWMAGVALYGDLKYSLQSKVNNVFTTIENAKIIERNINNEPELYGLITSDVVYQVDSLHPSENRIYTLATTASYSLMGTPSSWSSKIDELCTIVPDDDTSRLFVISAGNFILNQPRDIPTNNQNESVQDPANAYNALTVGYFSSEDRIIGSDSYEPYSDIGDIGASSTSSHTWYRNSPIKPDVIFEGGNYGYDSESEFSSEFESLSILTTAHDSNNNLLSYFGETSAATALAANFISKLWFNYPTYWPETIRALVVHSAEWPDAIKQRFLPAKSKNDIEALLRISGYGYPMIDKALYSGNRNVNLIIEDNIQPYTHDGKLNEMLCYSLPWPENELIKMSGEEVKLRVTLSYFIEPNPGERGWENKYKYSSFGLRFDLNASHENQEEFISRINKKFREDNPDISKTDGDASQWLLGPKIRNKGSIHSDVWSGTAQELSEKRFIAIYPVSGWWKDLKKENKQSSHARFSLIISIETKNNNLMIYNEIENNIVIENKISNDIEIAIPIEN